MRSQRALLISHSYRGLHRGQRSLTAQTGRTYDRTAPVAPSLKSTCLRGRSTYETSRRPQYDLATCRLLRKPRHSPSKAYAVIDSGIVLRRSRL
jgi:hypothetical protein